jgi:hypothetical protein
MDESLWDVSDGRALIRHIYPGDSFVGDEVNRVRLQFRKPLARIYGREGSMEVFRRFYDGLQRHRFGYEIEAAASTIGWQAIRTPTQIVAHRTATCIDLACLFASVLEAAGHNPLIAIVEGPEFAHALAGYRVFGEPTWENRGMDDLQGALARRDAVLYEPTGVAEVDEPVAAETADERSGKSLSFMDAEAAAIRPDSTSKRVTRLCRCR